MLFQNVPWGAAFTIPAVPLVTRGGTDYLMSPTLGSGDVKVSKDNGAKANSANNPSVSPAASGMVQLQLSATEMEATTIVVDFIDTSSIKEWEDQRIVITTELARGAIAFFVVADGANAAGSFEIDYAGGDDELIYRLLVINTGALAGQVRPVSDFDTASNFVTLASALSGTPATGVKGVLINR